MGKFIKGDIIVIPFPFSDLSNSKKRPAFVVQNLDGDDIILCQITSKNIKDRNAILLLESDFTTGSLNQISNVRPNRLFTADKEIIIRKIGHINNSKTNEIIDGIVNIISK
jgi:mRNA interferase MazF